MNHSDLMNSPSHFEPDHPYPSTSLSESEDWLERKYEEEDEKEDEWYQRQQQDESVFNSPEMHHPQDDDDDESEEARPSAPQPTPYQRQSPDNSHQFITSPQPFHPFDQLNTPPMLQPSSPNYHTDMKSLSPSNRLPLPQTTMTPTPINHQHHTPSTPAPLTDYRGTPIDPAMRRNLVALSTKSSRGHKHNSSASSPEIFFREASSTPLSIVAEQTLLNTFASPQKSRHLKQLEAEMSRMNHGHETPAIMNISITPTSAAHPNDSPELQSFLFDDTLDSPLDAYQLEVEDASVEYVDDAVEEMGTSNATDTFAVEHQEETGMESEHWQDHEEQTEKIPQTPMISKELFTTPTSQEKSFIGSPMTHQPHQQRFESNSSQKIRAPPLSDKQISSPVIATPVINTILSNRFTTPRSAPTLSSVKKLSTTTTSSKKKKFGSGGLASKSLPKIQPPTLEQWQLEKGGKPLVVVKPKTKTSGTLQKQLKRNLDTIKSKAKPTTMKGKSTTQTLSTLQSALNELSHVEVIQPEPHQRQPLAPIASSNHNIMKHSSIVTSKTEVIDQDDGVIEKDDNPWLTDAELIQAAVPSKPIATPSKRFSSDIQYTATPVVKEAATVPVTAVKAPPSSSTSPTPTVSTSNLIQPLQPYQPYRRVAPSLWTRQIQPDKIHDNLKYFTTAYACAYEEEEEPENVSQEVNITSL